MSPIIFQANIGDLRVTLDDEMVDERPTPEVAADYLSRCVSGVVKLYEAIPDGVIVDSDLDTEADG